MDAKLICQPLDAPKREVPFAPLQTPHVRPVHTQLVRESLLTQASSFPVDLQVLSHDALQISFHTLKATNVLLLGLHTYKWRSAPAQKRCNV